MTQRCPERKAVVAAILGRGSAMSRAEMSAAAAILKHAERCADCLRVIEAADRLSRAYGEGIDADTFAVAVHEHVDRILARTRVHRWPTEAASDPTMQHEEVIQYLRACANRVADSDVRRATDYAGAAAAIAEKLFAHGQIAADLMIETLRDHSTALRNASMYGAALTTLTTAESLTERAEDPRLQRAILRLCRAILLADANVCQFDEADTLAAECESELGGRDARRAAIATYVRAGVRRLGGRSAEALGYYERARDGFAAAVGESSVDAALAQEGVAACLVGTGRQAEARPLLISCREVFERLDMRAEVARTKWHEARADARDGEFDRAIDGLHSVARAFLDIRMFDDWVRVRLEIVGVMLERDPGANVADICESIAAMSISLDEREPNRSHRCTAEALEYLRQSARRQMATSALTGYVQGYIAAADAGRFAPFVPPSALVM